MNKLRPGHKKLGGRRKGTPNKFTTVKQAFLDFLSQEGGVEFLRKVAKSKQGAIAVLNAISRLLPRPVELSGPDGRPINIHPIKTVSEMSDEELVELKMKLATIKQQQGQARLQS